MECVGEREDRERGENKELEEKKETKKEKRQEKRIEDNTRQDNTTERERIRTAPPAPVRECWTRSQTRPASRRRCGGRAAGCPPPGHNWGYIDRYKYRVSS